MSDAMFAPSPSQHQLHQHHMQQALHHQQQIHLAQEQVGDGTTPPTPEIRISSAHRSGKSNATPLPQMRNPPEPYVHEFQPKTPERGDPGRQVNGGEGEKFIGPSKHFLHDHCLIYPHSTPLPSLYS